MRTVAEIDGAIQKLQPVELRELFDWVADYQAMIGASESLFSADDIEESTNAII